MVSETIRPVADMHLHSSISDGLYSPSKLMEICAENNLKAVALTDHESTDGITEAQEAGKRLGIEVIPGVEIGAFFYGREIHLLGYFAAPDPRLEKMLSSLRNGRYERMAGMLALLSGKEIKINMGDIRKEARKAAPSRLHLARACLLYTSVFLTMLFKRADYIFPCRRCFQILSRFFRADIYMIILRFKICILG